MLLGDIDRLLRGSFTKREDLAAGRIEIPTRTLVLAGLLLGALYGVFMGLYGALRAENATVLQVLASVVKVPLLFLLTLFVTFPSLYVFSALADSSLRALDTLRLLLVSVAVNLAVLASFGPVTGFFTLSTESYPFMVLLNVVFFTVAGMIGLAFLGKALDSIFVPERPPQPPQSPPSGADVKWSPVGRARPGRPRLVMRVWTLIYAVVGAQMGWILRPFVGSPDLPFTFFRERESNFFQAVVRAFVRLFTDG